MKGKSQMSTTEVKGGDWVLRFERGCEQILANAMLPSGVWKPNTVCCVCFNPIACLPLHQLTCQHLLLLICSLSWADCIYATPPGRPTRESSIFCFFCAQERREEWREMPGGGRGQTELSCWLIYPAKKKKSSSFFPPSSASCFFTYICVAVQMWISHMCVHTRAQTTSHHSPVLSLSCQANKDPLFLTGVTFPSEYPASPETLVKLSVYDAKDKTQESVSKHFLLCMCVRRICAC